MLELARQVLEAEIDAERRRVLLDQPARCAPRRRRVGSTQQDGRRPAEALRELGLANADDLDQLVDRDFPGRVDEPGARRRQTEDPRRRGSRRAQVADSLVAIRFGELRAVRAPQEVVVDEARRLGAAEKARELDLTSGRGEEVLAADDDVDLLLEIVRRHRELVGPATVAIARQQIAALLGRNLTLPAAAQVVEPDLFRLEPDPPHRRRVGRHGAIATRPRVAELAAARLAGGFDLPSGTSAGVDEAANRERRERPLVNPVAIALPRPRFGQVAVGDEAKPVEIFQQRRLVLRPTPRSVVVLDAQDHPPAERPRHCPDPNRVGHVAEMEEAGRRRREAGPPGRRRQKDGHRRRF